MYVFSISYSHGQTKSGGCPLLSSGVLKNFVGVSHIRANVPPLSEVSCVISAR